MDIDRIPIKPIEIPFQYPDVEPVQARIKSRPEDFIVEEELAYPLCGNGEHLFCRVEKKGWAMERLLSHLREALDVSHSQIGYAGLKDKVAVTRQWISVPRSCEERLERINRPPVRLLEHTFHTNKLRTGHLRGNHFSILLRGTPPGSLPRVETVGSRLVEEGMVNIFGNQRFGRNLESVRVGRDMVVGTMRTSGMSRLKRKFSVSAIQSYLFNLYVKLREERGQLRTVLRGDVLKKRDTGGLFVAADAAVEQARLDCGELVITGPIFGRKMKAAGADSFALEQEVLTRLSLRHDSFDGFQAFGAGTRRTLLTFPTDLSCEQARSGVRVRFFLPKGCYATVFLRDIVKREI